MQRINFTLPKLMLSIVAILLSSLSFSHHSPSEFSNSSLEVEGTLVQVRWRNPHPSLTFKSSSTQELWSIQLPGNIASLSADGITKSSFLIGQSLRIAGLESPRSENYMQATNILFPAGNELVVKPGAQALWIDAPKLVNKKLISNELITSATSNTFQINLKMFLILFVFASISSAYLLMPRRNKSAEVSA